MRWFELDFGWFITQVLASLSVVEILHVASGKDAMAASEDPEIAVVATY